jgi:hypothetical protein
MHWHWVLSINGRFSIKIAHFGEITAIGNYFFWLENFENIFSSETACSNEQKLITKHLRNVLYTDCSFRPDALTSIAAKGNSFSLIGQFLKILSETACPNKLEIGTNHIYKVLYDDCSFSFYPLTNMAATSNYCFCLVNFYKSSPLKLLAQN